jgi:hypothetical protein
MRQRINRLVVAHHLSQAVDRSRERQPVWIVCRSANAVLEQEAVDRSAGQVVSDNIAVAVYSDGAGFVASWKRDFLKGL